MMKNKFLLIIKFIVSVGLLIFLFRQINIQNVIDRYADLDVRFLVLAYVMLVIQYLLSTFKWQNILQSDNISMPYGFLMETCFIGNFISFFLPSGFGGDIYRVYDTQNINQNLLSSTSSVLFDRLSGLFALLSIACISYVFLPNVPYNFSIIILYVASILLFG